MACDFWDHLVLGVPPLWYTGQLYMGYAFALDQTCAYLRGGGAGNAPGFPIVQGVLWEDIFGQVLSMVSEMWPYCGSLIFWAKVELERTPFSFSSLVIGYAEHFKLFSPLERP